jgi:hypothetical protein
MQRIAETVDVVEIVGAPAPSNPQLFKNNSGLVDEYLQLTSNTDSLHGSRPPNLGINHEKPEHRLVLFFKLEGYSNREVAEKTGYTESWISQLTRQPWFQKRLINELNVQGKTGMLDYLRVQVADSFLKLVDLRDNAESEQVQVTCAINILDRALGKPVQRSEVTMETSKKVEKVEGLAESLKSLQKKLAAYGN